MTAPEDAAPVFGGRRRRSRVLGLGLVEVLVLVVAQTTVYDLAVDALADIAVQAQTVLLELYLGVPQLVARWHLLEVTLGAAASLVGGRARRAEPLTVAAQIVATSASF